MIALTVIAGCILVLAVYVAVMRHENRSDDRAARRDPFPRQPDHDGFADIKRDLEVAHELAPFPGPITPPATRPALLPSAPRHPGGAEPRPGDAAAAGAPPSPPPLPDPIDRAARIAAENPGAAPFYMWDPTIPGSDEFVEAHTAALKDGAR